MDNQVRNKWGYIPIVTGFLLIAIGTVILIIHAVVNNELSGMGTAYAHRFDFWFYWAPKITFFLIAGALFAVFGIIILRKSTSIWSYISVAGGFLLIAIDSYFLIVNWVKDNINIIGLYNFYLISTSFFSILMAGVFLIALGIILGLGVRNKWGITSVASGLVLILLGMSLLIINIETTIDIDPVGRIASFRWYFFWQILEPIIPFSLIIGVFFMFLGIYLIMVRNRNRRP